MALAAACAPLQKLGGKSAGAELCDLGIVVHMGPQLCHPLIRFPTTAGQSSLPSALQSHVGPDKEDLDITEDGWLASRCFGERGHGCAARRRHGLQPQTPCNSMRPHLARSHT